VQKISLYSVGPYIEFEWTVGPVPVDDGQGKEIIIRFNQSDIASNGTWQTDSNGRELQTRIRNFRPTWKWTPTQPVAGNYYPVNTGQALYDDKNCMVVLNDRSQGAASLVDGQLEFMIHRRILNDDGRGVGEPLNETQSVGSYSGDCGGCRYGPGLVITGTHYVVLSTPAEASALYRPLQQRVYQPLTLAIAPLTGAVQDYVSNHTTRASFLQSALPPNVELLSLYPLQSNNSALLRLVHNYGIQEDPSLSQPAQVDVAQLFSAASGKVVKQMTLMSLTAQQQKGEMKKRLEFRVQGETDEEREEMEWNRLQQEKKVIQGTTVTLFPLQIVTLQLDF